MDLSIKTYNAIQLNGYLRFYPIIAMVSCCVENYRTSAENIQSAHSVSIHVIIELETRRFSISRYRELKLCVITGNSGRRRLDIHIAPYE